ncbi:hypothetical protein J7J39_01275, partial [bacterium]|nr:hypothetical protein [bacterium]
FLPLFKGEEHKEGVNWGRKFLSPTLVLPLPKGKGEDWGEEFHLYPPPPTGRGRILRGDNLLFFSKGGYGRDPLLFLRGYRGDPPQILPLPLGGGGKIPTSYFIIPTSPLRWGRDSRSTLHASRLNSKLLSLMLPYLLVLILSLLLPEKLFLK